MIDIKKIDDKDIVFVKKPSNHKEDMAFSDFLKKRKAKSIKSKSEKKLKELHLH